VRLNASENNQINPSTIVRAAQGDGSRPNLASVLQEGGESANIHVRDQLFNDIRKSKHTPRSVDSKTLMIEKAR
jgi:hypothetical protein